MQKIWFKNKNKKTEDKRGSVILEILIVVFILGLLALVVFPSFFQTRQNQVLKNGVEDIITSLNRAKAQTLASKNSSEYGVRFENDRVIIFSGTTYSVSATDNEIINLISPARIYAVTLNGVENTEGSMYFNRLSGMPSQAGTVLISTVTNGRDSTNTRTITISSTGNISVN